MIYLFFMFSALLHAVAYIMTESFFSAVSFNAFLILMFVDYRLDVLERRIKGESDNG